MEFLGDLEDREMRCKGVFLVVWAVVFVCASGVFGVDRLVPGGYPTIQAGIDAAGPGDVVIVSVGTYNENLDFLGKAITVTSSNPADPAVVAATVIDCAGSGRGVYFGNGEGVSSVLDGLTITGGVVDEGGGIYCNGASPTIKRCVVAGNNASSYGGGIYAENSSAVVSNCVVRDNISDWTGGGLILYNCTAVQLSNSVVSGNRASYGGGIEVENSTVVVSGCTFSGNIAVQVGGAVDVYGPSSLDINNSIFWGDSANIGAEIDGTAVVSYSDVQGGFGGTGNIDSDPCFVNAGGGDYHLLADSPCIDAGDPGYSAAPGETDIDSEFRVMGTGIEMGADELLADLIPRIEVLPSELSFTAALGGPNPDPQILAVRNSGLETLNWEINEDCDWLGVTPTSGESLGEIDSVTVAVDINSLSNGQYDCVLTVSDANAENNPQLIPVTLILYTAGTGIFHVPSEFPTIQAAIDVSWDGDIIVLAPMTYTGTGNRDLDFGGKAVIVRSFDPEDPCVVAATVIDCENSGRGFYFHSGEGSDSVVAGLTITNGHASEGGGIYSVNSSPTIDRCVMVGNLASYRGGGLYLHAGRPTITNCKITDNSAGEGGGMHAAFSNFKIADSMVTGNVATQGTYANYGGGISCSGPAAPQITNCTITGNTARNGAGLNESHGSTPNVVQCIVFGNQGSEIYGDHSVSYSNVEGGYPGEGNVTADPLFVNSAGGDYHLSPASPCIDAGDSEFLPALGETDFDGEPRVMGARVDMGADEFTDTPVPVIEVFPTEFAFNAIMGGPNPEAQSLFIRNLGAQPLTWQVTDPCDTVNRCLYWRG